MNLLILEDDLALSYTLSSELTQQGYTVLAVATAEDAMQALLEEEFDLLLADIVIRAETSGSMRGGLSLINWMKAEAQEKESLRTLPVLCITGSMNQPRGRHIAETAQLLGADILLRKPVTAIEVRDAIHALLPNSHT